MRINLVIAVVLLVPSFSLAGSITISADASGQTVPGSATWPDTLTSGDFVINGNSWRRDIGDGVDETTGWILEGLGYKLPSGRRDRALEEIVGACMLAI